MDRSILSLFVVFFVVRVYTLIISIKNEKALKASGGVEHGVKNSAVLALLHVTFYLAAFYEGYQHQVQFDSVTIYGLLIYIFAIAALFYVIRQLGEFWTVKLIIAKGHKINKNFIFRYIRHPNYFLNLIPELIGLVLIMKAYTVMTYLFPVYMLSLALRIWQEERIMRKNFSEY